MMRNICLGIECPRRCRIYRRIGLSARMVTLEYCKPKAMPLGYELGGLSARMDVCEYCNFKVMLNLLTYWAFSPYGCVRIL